MVRAAATVVATVVAAVFGVASATVTIVAIEGRYYG